MTYCIQLDEAAARLYAGVAEQTGRPVETVLADALFKLAGELSLEALSRKGIDFSPGVAIMEL